MRFHVNYNEAKIFIGFYPKNHRFVFYTHGKIFTVAKWKRFISASKLSIFDEEGNILSWDEFIAFVDHCQYYSNTRWVNKFFISNEGYNFSDNRSDNRAMKKSNL